MNWKDKTFWIGVLVGSIITNCSYVIWMSIIVN